MKPPYPTVPLPNSEVTWCRWPRVKDDVCHRFFCGHDPEKHWTWDVDEWYCDVCETGVAVPIEGRPRTKPGQNVRHYLFGEGASRPSDLQSYTIAAPEKRDSYASETALVRSGAVTNSPWERWCGTQDRTADGHRSRARWKTRPRQPAWLRRRTCA